jgi:hypothetical protein
MPDAPAAASLAPNGPPPNAVDPRSSQRPAWADKAANDVSAAKERLGLSGNNSFLDRVMAKTSPDAEPAKEAPKQEIDTRGTKVLGKDQQNPKEKKVDAKENTPPADKISSTEAVEKLLSGEIDAEEAQPGKDGKDAPESKETAKEEGVEGEDKTKTNSQQDKGSEKERYKWGELKAKAEKFDELEPKYKELEEKVKAAEASSKVKDYEELQKKYEETSSKLAAFDVQESEEFREHVIKPIDQRYDFLEKLSKKYKLDMDAFEKSISIEDEVERNAAISKLISESEEPVDPVSAARAAAYAAEISELRAYGSELQKNAKQALEAMKLEREKSENEKSVKTVKEFADTAKITFDRMQKAIPYLKENPAEAKAIFDSIKPEDITKAPPAIQSYNAYAGLLLTKLLPQHKAQLATKDSKISELESRIAELTSGGPSINSDSQRSESNGTHNPLMRPQGVSMADWLLSQGRR